MRPALERFPQAIQICETHLAGEVPAEVRALWLNALAFHLITTADALRRAQAAASEAIAVLPWVGYVRGTMGIVQVESGLIDGGLELLDSADADDPTESGRTLRAAYKALAHAKARRPERARHFVEAARQEPLAAQVVRRVEELLRGLEV